MIKLQRILVATDFSAHGKVAMRYAAALAEQFGAEVIAVHIVEQSGVLPPLPTGERTFSEPTIALQVSRARDEAEKLLGELGAANSRVLVECGRPFVEIVRLARNEDADLVVVGTHGHGAVAHMLLGSVAERVIRKSPCPVLVVREGEHDFVPP